MSRYRYISNDLMVDIMERLPSKSILRFRSLSKYWHSRLVTQHFVLNHRTKNPQKVLIRYNSVYTLHSGDQFALYPPPGYMLIPGVGLPGTIRLVGSCNGLLCLCKHGNIISLWNLSIRQELIIQATHPIFKYCPFSYITLGFGFDLITDDYKIVAIAFGVVEPITCVYSLKKDSWSKIPRSVSIRNFDLKLVNDACFINGILHWVVDDNMAIRPTQVVPEETRRFILTFDLGSHVFCRILLPKRWEVKQLTAINGCLALVYSRGCDVWKIRVMKEYNEAGSSWPVVYRFKQEGYDVIRAVQLVSNGDLLAHFEGLKVYDQRKMLRSVIEPLRFRPRWFIETYVESLELLNEERATTFGETIFTYTRKDKFKRICL